MTFLLVIGFYAMLGTLGVFLGVLRRLGGGVTGKGTGRWVSWIGLVGIWFVSVAWMVVLPGIPLVGGIIVGRTGKGAGTGIGSRKH
jgi:hypothetical protein